MKHLIESLNSRVRKIRNNPDMASTHLALAISEITDCLEALAISEITDCLEALDTCLRAIEFRQAEQEMQGKKRADGAIGAMVPTETQCQYFHNNLHAYFTNGTPTLSETPKGLLQRSEAGGSIPGEQK